jgi:hypothetical protein
MIKDLGVIIDGRNTTAGPYVLSLAKFLAPISSPCQPWGPRDGPERASWRGALAARQPGRNSTHFEGIFPAMF